MTSNAKALRLMTLMALQEHAVCSIPRFFCVRFHISVQCEAPKIAFSWFRMFITPITMVYGTYNYSYWG